MASVVNIYARAFADVVLEKRLDPAKTLAEAQQMSSLVRDNKALREVWQAPSVSADQKRAVLDAIAKRAGISQMVRNFIAVLIDKGRMRFLDEIVARSSMALRKGSMKSLRNSAMN